MGDPVNKATSFQGGAGTSPQQPPAGNQPNQPANAVQPDTITRAEAEQLAKDAEDKAFQRAQSLYEKGRSRFEERVNQALASLKSTLEMQKKAGLQITPEQEAAMRQQVINDAFESEQATDPSGNPPTQPGQPAQPGQPGPGEKPQPSEPLDPVTAEAVAMMRQAGVTIDDNDPEAKLIKDTGTVREFLDSVEVAIKAKQQRTSTAPQALTPGLGAGNQAPNPWQGRKGLDLLQEHFRNQQ